MRSPEQIENDIQNLLNKPAATVRQHKGVALGLSVLVLLLVAQFFVIVSMSSQQQSLLQKVGYYEKGFSGYREVGFDLYAPLPDAYPGALPPDIKVSL